MKFFKFLIFFIIGIIILYLLLFPIRYLIVDFGIQNFPKSIVYLMRVNFTNEKYIIVEEKYIENKIEYKYIIKPKNYLKTIEEIMRTYNYVPNNIGMLGERIPYNNLEDNSQIYVLHGFSRFYGILKFEKDN